MTLLENYTENIFIKSPHNLTNYNFLYYDIIEKKHLLIIFFLACLHGFKKLYPFNFP